MFAKNKNYIDISKRKDKMYKEEIDWTIQCIMPYPPKSNPFHINYHTIGMEEKYDNLDFQIVLPVDKNTAGLILNYLCHLVKRGYTITEDTIVKGLTDDNNEVYFVKRKEGNREVLRLVFPDNRGKYPDNPDCAFPFNKQLDNVFEK